MTYARARLWLGITGVGTVVTLAALGLAASPASFIQTGTLAQGASALAAFVALYALVHAPFDVLGGLILPRRFGRPAPTPRAFAARWARGTAVHALLLWLAGVAMLWGAVTFGVPGAVGAAIVLSLALLIARSPLMRAVAPIRVRRAGGTILADSDDEAFTGGMLAPGLQIIPAHWPVTLGGEGMAIVRDRRALIARRAWWWGTLGALAFTWLGIAAAALIVGGEALATAGGVIALSLIFTLWSFAGLLTLPTLSRRAVYAIDDLLRARGHDPAALSLVARRLAALQDGELARPDAVETVFHPLPAADRRADAGPPPRGPVFWNIARTAVFLSAAGMGLLGRAVHCNAGRPDLWVFLPSD